MSEKDLIMRIGSDLPTCGCVLVVMMSALSLNFSMKNSTNNSALFSMDSIKSFFFLFNFKYSIKNEILTRLTGKKYRI